MKKILLASLLSLNLAGAQGANICGPQTDSFAFIVDTSGSMMETFEEAKDKAGVTDDSPVNKLKISEASKLLIEKVANAIGEDKMTSSLYSVSPFAELAPLSERSGLDFKTLTDKKFNTTLEVFGRPSWIGSRAEEFFHKASAGKNTVILITDGALTDELNNPIESLEAFRRANPEARIYVISAAYTQEAKTQVSALNGQTFMPIINLETLVSDEKFFNDFVSAAIFNRCDERIELKGINFAFDKATLDQKSRDILRQALEVVKSRPITDALLIQGWTDSVGSDSYNKKLSARRAQAVKNYLIQNGVDADRITVRGEGKSFKYNNQTPKDGTPTAELRLFSQTNWN